MKSANTLKHLRLLALALPLSWLPVAQAMEDNALFNATRLEVDTGRASGGGSEQTLRAEGWVGTDYNRFAWKAEGEREKVRLEEAEVQALYARYLAPFWELQAGLRQVNKPNSRDYFALGVRGLAPYAFDVDLAMFARSDGKLSARTRAEYDLLWTNRIILRPYVFADWSASRIVKEDTKSGIENLEYGLNLRYEISRALAPYVELARRERYAISGNAGTTSVRVGLRLLF